MKFLSRRVVALAAAASIACLLTTPVQARAQDTLVKPSVVDTKANAGGSVDLHEKKHHHHHHHGEHKGHKDHKDCKPRKGSHKKTHKASRKASHKKSHKKHHHHHQKPKTVKTKTQLNLVCDHVIIDHIICTTEVPILAVSTEAQTPFDALNNGSKKVKPTQVYIDMKKPCSAELPSGCTAAREMALEAKEQKADGIENSQLWFKKNKHPKKGKHHKHNKSHPAHGKTHKHGEHHKHTKHTKDGEHKHHHHYHKGGKPGKTHGHGGKHGHKNHKHPYAGLCVSVGDFCGTSLYGCKFVPTTLYTCKAIGEKPEVAMADSPTCGGSGTITLTGDPCSCTSTAPVCGSQFPATCEYEPNAIYQCPGGPLSAPTILKQCIPGTQCTAGQGGADPTCGFNTCDCSDDTEVCSSQFPSSCGLTPNSRYKCGTDGKPLLLSACDGGQECVYSTDGSVCVPSDCSCTGGGVTCGRIFPLSCRLPASSFYTCQPGQAPVASQDCSPDTCTTKVAILGGVAED
ncbi:hypothetical protein BGX26_008834 [Mortierella sp. AD094]|nr:hypothetical protein BGX26_008834 [Mortierella sp. AD094]